MRKPALFLMIFAVSIGLSTCGGSETADESTPEPVAAEPPAPTPESTVAAMLELAEAGNWESYVDDYYGEQDKFQEGDRDKLVARFRDKWGEQVAEQLKVVADITPELSEDGNLATFKVDETSGFKLYKADDGLWKFHL